MTLDLTLILASFGMILASNFTSNFVVARKNPVTGQIFFSGGWVYTTVGLVIGAFICALSAVIHMTWMHT